MPRRPAAAVLLLASALAPAATALGCDGADALLFAFFQGDEQLYYATSYDGLAWTVLNGNRPVLRTAVPATSIRDPYLHAVPGGGYAMVSTDGQAFGGNPNVLTWTTKDLITYSPERVVAVMNASFFPPGAKVDDTWAPEFVWDALGSRFLVFWAAKGAGIYAPEAACSNSVADHFAFFGAHTTDFATFSPPFLLFDPGCTIDGMGGIDGDLVQDENGLWTLVFKDARGDGEPVRGVRSVASSTGLLEGPYLDGDISPLISPTLVEAPEAVYFPLPSDPLTPRWLLYYDCSFFPTPQGWPRPPYGVSTSPSLAAPQWTPVPGACTGGGDTAFPKGATHGSFVCLSNATLASLWKAFPPAAAA